MERPTIFPQHTFQYIHNDTWDMDREIALLVYVKESNRFTWVRQESVVRTIPLISIMVACVVSPVDWLTSIDTRLLKRHVKARKEKAGIEKKIKNIKEPMWSKREYQRVVLVKGDFYIYIEHASLNKNNALGYQYTFPLLIFLIEYLKHI